MYDFAVSTADKPALYRDLAAGTPIPESMHADPS